MFVICIGKSLGFWLVDASLDFVDVDSEVVIDFFSSFVV